MVGTRTVLQPPWAQQPHPQSPLLLPGAKQQLHPRHPGPAGGEVRDRALGDPGGLGDHPTALAVPQGGRAHLGPAPAQVRSVLGPVSGTQHPVRSLLPQQDPCWGCVAVPPSPPAPLLPSVGAALPCPTRLPLPPVGTTSSTGSGQIQDSPTKQHTFSLQLSSSEQGKLRGAGVFLPGSLIIPRVVWGCSQPADPLHPQPKGAPPGCRGAAAHQ